MTMTVTLPLDVMSVNDKIQAMESIWLSFMQNPSEMESPAWHGDVLAVRETRASDDSSRYGDWNEAKLRIRAAVQS